LFNKYLLSVLIGHNKSLRSRAIAGPRPKERIRPVAVIVEAHNQEGVLIYGVHIAGHLMMVRVQFSQILSAIRTILLLVLGH